MNANKFFSPTDFRTAENTLPQPLIQQGPLWTGDWRVAIAEERVAMAEERLARAKARLARLTAGIQ